MHIQELVGRKGDEQGKLLSLRTSSDHMHMLQIREHGNVDQIIPQ